MTTQQKTIAAGTLAAIGAAVYLAVSPPPTPLMLCATCNPVDNAIGYRVYGGQSLTRSDWVLLGESPSNRVAFPTQVPGYGFIGLKAYNQYGESDWATQ